MMNPSKSYSVSSETLIRKGKSDNFPILTARIWSTASLFLPGSLSDSHQAFELSLDLARNDLLGIHPALSPISGKQITSPANIEKYWRADVAARPLLRTRYDGRTMMKALRTKAITTVIACGVTLLSGCWSSTKETTAYVPAAPPQVVVQPAPVVVSPPAVVAAEPSTVTTSTTKQTTNSYDSRSSGAMDAPPEQSTTTYKSTSESTTVAPQ
jgi:hypothetical protein